MMTFASLFSGGGGADCGAIAAGLVPLFAVEYDPAIAEVYRQNIGPHVIVSDVAAVDYSLLPIPDLLHASPVCTNASQAKTDGTEATSDLAAAEAVCRALRTMQPRLFTLENVIPYRSFQSYRLICQALSDLGYIWHAEHCNAADFAVPQTRRRLILRASRDGLLRGLPAPEKWRGWYQAIADLIPTLPESKFAQWQLQRLPAEFAGSLLVHPTDMRGMPTEQAHEAAFTVMAGSFATSHAPSWKPRAFIVDGMPNANGQSVTVRDAAEPMMTVSANGDKRKLRAFLVSGQSVQGGPPVRRDAEQPAMTITPNMDRARAFLIRDDNAGQEWGRQYRTEHEPAFTQSASSGGRAWLSQGKVVAMTPRALAAFQSFPRSYVLPTNNALACRVIGNACPPLMMQRIFESLL